MRTYIKNYIEAEKRRREEAGEEGFSLIELIIVVVILGILAAIAIPIFLNISDQAATNAAEAAAGNAASQYAAQLAQSGGTPDMSNWADQGWVLTINGAGDLDNFCIEATNDGGDHSGQSGPGCTS